jgi:hypothetical protein
MAECIQELALLALLERKDKNVHSVSICNVHSVSISSLSTRRSSVFFPGTKVPILTLRMQRFVCLFLYAHILTYADVC